MRKRYGHSCLGLKTEINYLVVKVRCLALSFTSGGGILNYEVNPYQTTIKSIITDYCLALRPYLHSSMSSHVLDCEKIVAVVINEKLVFDDSIDNKSHICIKSLNGHLLLSSLDTISSFNISELCSNDHYNNIVIDLVHSDNLDDSVFVVNHSI